MAKEMRTFIPRAMKLGADSLARIIAASPDNVYVSASASNITRPAAACASSHSRVSRALQPTSLATWSAPIAPAPAIAW